MTRPALLLLVVCGALSAAAGGGSSVTVIRAGGEDSVGQARRRQAIEAVLAGRFQWSAGRPLVAPAHRPEDPCFSVKDPSVVFHEGRWHLFCTVRGQKRTHSVEYLSFASWDEAARAATETVASVPQEPDSCSRTSAASSGSPLWGADSAPRQVLKASDGYYCAPQVFYFVPQKKWYLICQASDPSWTPKYQAAYSTTATIGDPASWAPLKSLGAQPANGKVGLDFWIICDEKKAHLFFTTLDGRMWREETTLEAFPACWSKPVLAIQGDIFEAGHVYKLKGLDKYLALIEAQGGHGWRYYKAYLADRLDGAWQPLADSKDKSFASMANVLHPKPRWTDCVSHGELIREGYDQTLQVDPAHLRFVFQGVLDKDRAGKPYGEIPWRLGILEPAPIAPAAAPAGE